MDLEALKEKWQDALDCADSYLESNLIGEFVEDLEHLRG